jgi:hypothetical protein
MQRSFCHYIVPPWHTHIVELLPFLRVICSCCVLPQAFLQAFDEVAHCAVALLLHSMLLFLGLYLGERNIMLLLPSITRRQKEENFAKGGKRRNTLQSLDGF